METFSALLAICAGNSPVSGEFPAQRQVTRSFDVFFDLRLNERLSKQSWGWSLETQSRLLWRKNNEYICNDMSSVVVHTEISLTWDISPFVALQTTQDKIALDMCKNFRRGHRVLESLYDSESKGPWERKLSSVITLKWKDVQNFYMLFINTAYDRLTSKVVWLNPRCIQNMNKQSYGNFHLFVYASVCNYLSLLKLLSITQQVRYTYLTIM